MDELQRIFDALPDASESTSKHWLPILGTFTGARLGELCQIRKDDVVDAGGIATIRITDEGGKRTKNANAIRIIPIHPELKVLAS